MTSAYDKIYLDKGQVALGRMLDFAVHDLGYGLSEFFELFLTSQIASRFQRGDFALLVGMSGVELAYAVLEDRGISCERILPRYTTNRSEEYWAGWALAYYQWSTGLTFEEIVRYTSMEALRRMYTPYHEMDIRQFVDEMNRRYREAQPHTNLKRLRLQANLSQRELAELSAVPFRTIQQYEQRQKNINRAQGIYLVQLAQVLHCNMEDLLERVE